MRSRSTSVINGAIYPTPTAAAQSAQPPGLDSLLQLAARLASAPRAIILPSDHPGNDLAKFAVNIPLIARNGRHLGHLCLHPGNPLTECRPDDTWLGFAFSDEEATAMAYRCGFEPRNRQASMALHSISCGGRQ